MCVYCIGYICCKPPYYLYSHEKNNTIIPITISYNNNNSSAGQFNDIFKLG